MLIFLIEDEPPLLLDERRAIAEAAPDAEIMTFENASDALDAIESGSHKPDIVFSDIEMPEMTGLDFAVALKNASPDTRVVFVTGYSQYALDAFKVRAQGYLMKPLTAEQVKTEIEHLPQPAEAQPEKLQVKCFGHFEVFVGGKPVIFARKQTKELLAYLIDQNGRVCTAEEICAAIWEEEGDIVAAKHRLRTVISDLRRMLAELGFEDVLVRERRQLAVRRSRIDCDYYRMLDGDVAAVNSFHGEYMVEYSWAELTTGRLHYRSE